MLKEIKRHISLIHAFLGLIASLLVMSTIPVVAAHAQAPDRELQKMNSSYALGYLRKAVEFYTDARYADSLACIEKGVSFDASFADFFYLKAQCLLKLKARRAECLEAAETAFTSGLKRSIYSKEDIAHVLARLYVETKHYTDALDVLNTLSFDCADCAFYRACVFYGLGHDEKAHSIIEQALSRWSFDTRFPLLFFVQERSKTVSSKEKKLAHTLLQRLYSWLEYNPALAVYAAPFEPNHEENRRRLQAYRAMHGARQNNTDVRTELTAILAQLRYGVIDEHTAVQEFFTIKTALPFIQTDGTRLPAFYADQLVELCSLIGDGSTRKEIGARLKVFDGILLEDNDNDMILDSAVLFHHGRPLSAFFDINQDEQYEYQVHCNFGTPSSIFTQKNNYSVQYDSYPSVHSIIQTGKKKTYTMRPLALRWEPVIQDELDLHLRDTDTQIPPFFTIRLRDTARLLQEHDFIFSTLHAEEPSTLDKNAVRSIHFDEGAIMSAETTVGSQVLAREQYRNGVIAEKEYDYDRDGFFETFEQYDKQGKLAKISVDGNKNKAFEYYELYQEDGTVIKNWDENEDGKPEIQYTKFSSGAAQTVWTHRYSGAPVSVFYKNGKPERLTIGTTTVPLIKDAAHNVYYLGMRPYFSDKAAEMLAQWFKDKGPSVAARTVMIGRYELYAVRSEGAVFVQVFAASTAASYTGREGR